MKIKTQFTILIAAIALVPLACAVSFPIYHYLTSPQRYLMKGYKELKKLNRSGLSESELDEIREMIRFIPSDMQIAIYNDPSIIISNIPDLKAGTKLSIFDIFTFISETSNEYDYQMQGRYGLKSLGA